MEHSFIQDCFELATVHCSQAMQRPTIQRYAAMVAWHKAEDFSDINTTHRALTIQWIEAKWLMWQLWWWVSDRGCVMETDWPLSLHRSIGPLQASIFNALCWPGHIVLGDFRVQVLREYYVFITQICIEIAWISPFKITVASCKVRIPTKRWRIPHIVHTIRNMHFYIFKI
jgi:hypothetical protein